MLTHVRRAALREKFGKRSWSAGGQKECLYMCLFYKPGIRFTAIIGGGSGRPRECSLRLGTIAPATETGLARFPEKRPLQMWCRRSLRVTVALVVSRIIFVISHFMLFFVSQVVEIGGGGPVGDRRWEARFDVSCPYFSEGVQPGLGEITKKNTPLEKWSSG